jgi:hypothetical protein
MAHNLFYTADSIEGQKKASFLKNKKVFALGYPHELPYRISWEELERISQLGENAMTTAAINSPDVCEEFEEYNRRGCPLQIFLRIFLPEQLKQYALDYDPSSGYDLDIWFDVTNWQDPQVIIEVFPRDGDSMVTDFGSKIMFQVDFAPLPGMDLETQFSTYLRDDCLSGTTEKREARQRQLEVFASNGGVLPVTTEKLHMMFLSCMTYSVLKRLCRIAFEKTLVVYDRTRPGTSKTELALHLHPEMLE